ncbi:MAG: cytochrome c oxidase assembly protein, partial [Natronospirillum sp.]
MYFSTPRTVYFMEVTHWLQYLMPWEFFWLWLLSCFGMAALYHLGLSELKRRGASLPAWWRSMAFYFGLATIYGVSHTYYDYLSQFLFFAHRAQHIVLHHLGPLLIAFSAPIPVLAAGLPTRFKALSIWPRLQMVVAPLYALVQQPIIASILFVGIIYFWLSPSLH